MGRKPCKSLNVFGRSNQRAFSAKSTRWPKASCSAQLKRFFLEGGFTSAPRSPAESDASDALHSILSNLERSARVPRIALWPNARTAPRPLAQRVPGCEPRLCDGRATGLQSQSNPDVDASHSPPPNNCDPYSETLRRAV